MAKRILIVTGEASGDLHAAKLITLVQQKEPNISFAGIGGTKMRAAGAEILLDLTQLSIVGFFEVLPRLWKFYSAFQIIRTQLQHNSPNLIILIDFSGFNLKVAKIAKKFGVKVLYYISPQIWASRPKRVQTIKKYVDQMVVIFPFELAYYQRARVPVKLIRHPLLDNAHSILTPTQACNVFGLDPQKKTVGLLPGSRKHEIKNLLPLLLETAKALKQMIEVLQKSARGIVR